MNDKAWKQKIVDDYLNASGRNQLIPEEFLAWVKDQPEHECYKVFFGKSNDEAALAYRLDEVRKWVRDIRIVVRYEEPRKIDISKIVVKEYVVPGFHSPVDGRRDGGGYIKTDPSDPMHLAELARQGATALSAWIRRFSDVSKMVSVDIASVDEIRVSLSAAADTLDPPKEIEAA